MGKKFNKEFVDTRFGQQRVSVVANRYKADDSIVIKLMTVPDADSDFPYPEPWLTATVCVANSGYPPPQEGVVYIKTWG